MQRREIAGIGIGKFLTGVIIAALVTGAAVFYLFYTGRFGGGSKFKLTSPARVGYEYSHLAADNNIVSDYLFSRSKRLIVEKGGDGVLAASSYTIAGRLVTQEATSSDVYGLSDQALLLKCYVRAGDRKNASALEKEVINRFRLPDGCYKAFVYSDEARSNEELILTSASIDWLDALMDYYISYGNNDDYHEIKRMSEILFDEKGRLRPEEISVAGYAESLYVGLDDAGSFEEESSIEQLYGTITGDVDSADAERNEIRQNVTGVLLSNINLRLIRDLESNGLIAQGAYETAVNAIKGGLAGSGYFYYAYSTAGEMDCGDYIYTGQHTGSIDISQHIKTMKNLAEAGELDNESFAAFKEQIMNSGRIYSEYVILTGNFSGGEAQGAYSDGLMLAYYMGDRDLYSMLSDTLGRRVATKSTSPALYMIFREENDRYVFYARENFAARLATS
ncbi:MAG: hypothetical protein K5665_02685 [Saccharofermentans sp.]|nr:hypothetical protein [Saccharofermentans sp.]